MFQYHSSLLHYSYHFTTIYLLSYTNLTLLLDANSLPIFFLHVLCCLNLLHEAISLTKTILIGSSSSKLSSSKLMLLRSIITRHIPSLKKCNNIRVYIIRVYIIIREYKITKFFKHFIHNKPVKISIKV